MNTEARTNAIAGSITVTVNEAAGQAAIERAKALLAGIPGGVDKAMKASMSRTVDRLRRESNQAIREKYDITDAGIRAEKNVRVRYSYQNGVQATVTFSGRKIPLYRFGGAYPKAPTQDIAAGRKPVMVKGAWTMQYQGVAARGHQFQDTIALMKKGTWTGGGHFVVLWWADDKVRINDPASTRDNRVNGNLATFKNEAAYFWIVDAREYNNSGKLVDGTVAEVKPEDVPQAATGVTAERKATGTAKGFDKKLAGTYTVTAKSGLHIRNVAGSKTGSMVVLPYGTKVRNYGYYTEVNGVQWLYIQAAYQGIKYTGFSSGAYLSKI